MSMLRRVMSMFRRRADTTSKGGTTFGRRTSRHDARSVPTPIEGTGTGMRILPGITVSADRLASTTHELPASLSVREPPKLPAAVLSERAWIEANGY